jgi:NDP-4-keto-2,6-dideoxyhexose 3-C-methyltransferase
MVKTDLFHEIAGCRICRSRDLVPVIDLGRQALTGRFPAKTEPDPPSAPLVVVRCTHCGLVQLRYSVDAGELFAEDYGYRSGINATMRDHLAAIVARVVERGNLKSGDTVLDIGCNDGTLLTAYQEPGLFRVGIDPLAEMFRPGYRADLEVHTGFFTAGTYISASGRPTARAITSIAMFYDLEDPGAFVSDVAAVLAADGIWVLEQSYLPSMLEQNSFDTICHEHLEYYSLAQIDRLARAHGLRVFDVGLNGINGGSFQVWVCHEGAGYSTDRARIGAIAEREQKLALMSEEPYASFRLRVSSIGDRLRAFIQTEASRGKKIYVYGASTKGNVLLQHFGLDASLIRACADKNPIKWGRRTPGTSIPIISEDAARADADYFLVLPWSFKDEFLARESAFRARGGRFIFPLPEIEMC